MTTRYTQKELGEMEKSLDDDYTSLKAEILEFTIKLSVLAGEGYNGTYQQSAEGGDLLRAQLQSIMDAMQFLSDSAGNLITAGEPGDPE